MKFNFNDYRPSKKILTQSGMILLGTILLAAVLEIQEKCSEKEVTRIERNDYGDGIKREELELQVEGEEEQTVILEISPKAFSEKELEELFPKAISELENMIVGENENLEYVTENLNLPKTIDDYPFTIIWQFSRYDVVDMNGRIQQDRLDALDPDRMGIEVTLTAILQYEMKEFSWSWDMSIYSQEKQELTLSEEILEAVVRINRELEEESYITLPNTVNGRKIVWKKEQRSETVFLLVLGSVSSVLVIGLERQKELEKEKKKREQMMFDYPEIISQFIILMGAGMTAKNVWKKMVEDYREQKNCSGKIRWAYEEMECTLIEMQNGVPEMECYERFAKKCDLLPYIKLGALLAQNLKKGTKGLWVQMEMEAHQAMNDRKNQVKRLGEEAGTKLLIPMLLMLVVVLLIVIVPAFLSIQI